MKKYFLPIALALGIALVLSVSAFAAAPSKTAGDLNAVVDWVTNGAGDDGFMVFVVEEPSQVFEQELARILEFAETSDAPIIDVFPAEIHEQIAELLPEGLDAETLTLNEYLPIDELNYGEQLGDVPVRFRLTTEYATDQTIVAVVTAFVESIGEDGSTVYTPVYYVLPAVAQIDSATGETLVTVEFTQEALLAVQGATTSGIAILSEPILP
jgi:hypothetical protein